MDIKEDWGRNFPSGVQGRSPSRGSGSQSPPEAETFFMKLHIIFALKYNKQQLLLLLDKISITSKILADITMDVPLHKYWGTCPPVL